jgi:2-beta-glucuronyltransferase
VSVRVVFASTVNARRAMPELERYTTSTTVHDTAAMSADARRVVLVSGHYLRSKRRAGFHNLAEAYWRLGWDVTFVTAAISTLSRLRGDYRFEYPVRAEANRLVEVRERLTSFVLMPWVHPGNLGSSLANTLATPLFARYARTPLGPLTAVLADSDVVIFESNASLLLVDQMRKVSPDARFVYRASDDLRGLGVHPLILRAEEKALPTFDLVSAPTRFVADALAPYAAVQVHPPGIDKRAFDRSTRSPYDRATNAVFVGVSHFFDYDALGLAASVRPDVAFHVLGLPPRDTPANVVFHGEIPFESVVPYLQHATFGLLPLPRDDPRLGVGNKVAQYSYCRLPVVAPAHLRFDGANICIYDAGDEDSLRRALAEAEQMPHDPAFAEGILSAEELALTLAGESDSGPF